MKDRYFISEKQRAIMFDAPLTRAKHGNNWIGAREIHRFDSVQRLLDRNFLTLDIDKDPQGRTALVTEEGKAALFAQ